MDYNLTNYSTQTQIEKKNITISHQVINYTDIIFQELCNNCYKKQKMIECANTIRDFTYSETRYLLFYSFIPAKLHCKSLSLYISF
jgi:hypothetical protein